MYEYDRDWFRPGAGMVALFTAVGLIAGILVGLFNPSGVHRGQGEGLDDQRTEQSTSPTGVGALPDPFYTVVLASIPISRDRSEAEARAQALRGEGVKDAGVLDPERYSSLSPKFWAVYSGVSSNQDVALAYRDDLRERYPDLAGCSLKEVSSKP